MLQGEETSSLKCPLQTRHWNFPANAFPYRQQVTWGHYPFQHVSTNQIKDKTPPPQTCQIKKTKPPNTSVYKKRFCFLNKDLTVKLYLSIFTYVISRAVLVLSVIILCYAFIITQKFNKSEPAYLSKALHAAC